MRLAEQWSQIVRDLPQDWADARVAFTPEDPRQLERAATILAPLTPGRAGGSLRLVCARRGVGPSPQAVSRALQRLDSERIRGTLELLASSERAVEAVMTDTARPSLAAAWDAEQGALPADWSDVHAELGLRSTDHLERAALLLAPLNPTRFDDRPAFRFRVASRFGYGASPGMTRRCLERLDEEGILGRVRILRALSDVRPVATQGAVWYVGGKAV
jgi:hypothetical protein